MARAGCGAGALSQPLPRPAVVSPGSHPTYLDSSRMPLPLAVRTGQQGIPTDGSQPPPSLLFRVQCPAVHPPVSPGSHSRGGACWGPRRSPLGGGVCWWGHGEKDDLGRTLRAAGAGPWLAWPMEGSAPSPVASPQVLRSPWAQEPAPGPATQACGRSSQVRCRLVWPGWQVGCPGLGVARVTS